MAATKLQAYNLALAHMGVNKRVSSLTENSVERTTLDLFWDDVVDELLRDFDFPFSRKKRALGLVTSNGDDGHADINYGYAYRYPSDCLNARRIDSGIRTDYRLARVSYDICADDQGQLILTDKQDAVLEFTTTDARNPARWTSDFLFSVSYRLAVYAAPGLTKGDPTQLGERCTFFFNMSNRKAQANAAGEVQPDLEPDSDLINART